MKIKSAAIIGCGAIHSVHADAISSLETVRLRVVADTDKEKAQAAAVKYDCKYTTDYTEILNNPDVQIVHLCTPHFLHAPMAKAFMQAGKHVITEKPMGLNMQECNELIEISRQTGRNLGVCLQNRYHDTSIKMKELVDSGEMGRVLGARAFLTWSRDRDYYLKSPWRGTWEKEGGSLLMNQAIHTLDLLQWLLGDVEDVKGAISTHYLSDLIETEDTAEAVLYFRSGTRALFYASNAYVSNSPIFLEIVCEHGSMTLNGELTVCWHDGRREVFRDVPPVGYKSYWGTGHKNLIADFYDCIDKGVPCPVNGVEGAKVVGIIQKIYEINHNTI
jgi:predicted dehydrogenase